MKQFDPSARIEELRQQREREREVQEQAQRQQREKEERANMFNYELEDKFSTLYIMLVALDNVFYGKKQTEKIKSVEKEARKVYDEIMEFLDDKPFFSKRTGKREYLGNELQNTIIDRYSDQVSDNEKQMTGYTPYLDEDDFPTGRYKKGSAAQVKKAMEFNERVIDKAKKFVENVLKPAPDEDYAELLRYYGLEIKR
jgi:transcriptional regulator with PAS, ATPase and Fis domain